MHSMFKSCQYCRHRKKRCKFPDPPGEDARCFACQRLGVSCEIAARRPSIKRQIRSQGVAARVNAAESADSADTPSASGDCQLPPHNIVRPPKELLLPSAHFVPHQWRPSDLYSGVVSLELPFVPEQCLLGEPSSRLSRCLDLAAQLSFRFTATEEYVVEIQHTIESIRASPLDLSAAVGLLLLLPRYCVDLDLIKGVFDFLSAYAQHNALSPPIEAGILAAQGWHGLLYEDAPQLGLPVDVLLDYGRRLAPDCFAPHYLKMTHLAASLARLIRTTQLNRTDPVTVKYWAKMENACLLSVAEMRSEFLDVRDDMPATPAAVVTHMLQNLIYLRLYGYLLCDNPHLGEALALRAVPGVLHFICAITRSTFICQPQVLHYWPLISEIQAAAARVMIDLWHLAKSDNCKALLSLWHPTSGHEELFNAARRLTATPWTVEAIDGYSVFWTFRDIRSLALEVLLRT